MSADKKTNSTDLIIEAMTLADLDEISELENMVFTTPWPRGAFEGELTTNALARYLVARLNKKIVGYIGIWLIFNEGHITNIAVHPDYRRRGIGDTLLQRLLSNAKGCSIESLTLEVRRSNLAAQKLYEKYGFIFTSVRPGYYTDNKEDALIYWKQEMDGIEPTDDWIVYEDEEEAEEEEQNG